MTAAPCVAIRRELPWFVGADLSVDRQQVVAEHLRACPACRRDAAGLQQAQKALAEAGRCVPAAADDAMFGALQESIVAAVAREAVAAGGGGPLRNFLFRRWAQGLAAAALFGLGWWLVDARTAPALLDRRPLATPMASGGVGKAVPYAGQRVQLQPLGHEWRPGADGVENGVGPGMMGRWSLRTLEDLDVVAPAPEVPADADRPNRKNALPRHR